MVPCIIQIDVFHYSHQEAGNAKPASTKWNVIYRRHAQARLTYKQASEEHLKEHYRDLSTKPFFPGLVKYMNSGPVVPMVWEGLGAVKTGRVILGQTNPADSAPGTIRGDYCIEVGRNIVHGSDSVESANKEINLWFTEKEIINWQPATNAWVYEN
ncbi:hypothetical protein FQA39_LY16399 [Lamprigera yunnana]|nr:hypothetical protein FQA39_LY16399 [Lamprigera yunnana]